MGWLSWKTGSIGKCFFALNLLEYIGSIYTAEPQIVPGTSGDLQIKEGMIVLDEPMTL